MVKKIIQVKDLIPWVRCASGNVLGGNIAHSGAGVSTTQFTSKLVRRHFLLISTVLVCYYASPHLDPIHPCTVRTAFLGIISKFYIVHFPIPGTL